MPPLDKDGHIRRFTSNEAWRNRTIEGEFPYVYLDGVVLKRSWAGDVRNISALAAIGVGTDGFRQILGVAEGEKEICRAGEASCGTSRIAASKGSSSSYPTPAAA